MKKVWIWTLCFIFISVFAWNSFAQEPLQIYVPPTPSSIPLILAAQNMENTEITIFSNHSQAHTLFLRGDIPILTTGLSVGVNFFKSDIPIQMINSYVSGLSYLITRDKKVESFQELQGEAIYIPFEGSPIEEITKFFVEQEGLEWKKDFKPVYSPFPSSLELLKKGEAQVVVLPQPLATIAAAQENNFISFGYKGKWDMLTDSTKGYPQVGTFVKQDWAITHRDAIHNLNEEIEKALQLIQENPEQAVESTKEHFKFPEKILLASLKKTAFYLSTSAELKQQVEQYYQALGNPLDETFDAFFYLDPQ